MYSLTAAGALRWSAPYAAGIGAVGSPALSPDGSRVYVASAWGSVIALSSATGATLWNVYVVLSSSGALSSTAFRGSPAVASDGAVLYVVNSINTIIALDLSACNALPLGAYVNSRSSEGSGDASSGRRAASPEEANLVLWSYDMGYTRSATAGTAGANSADSLPFESSPVSLGVPRSL